MLNAAQVHVGWGLLAPEDTLSSHWSHGGEAVVLESCRRSCRSLRSSSPGIGRQIGNMKQAAECSECYKRCTAGIAGDPVNGTLSTTLKFVLSQYCSGDDLERC